MKGTSWYHYRMPSHDLACFGVLVIAAAALAQPSGPLDSSTPALAPTTSPASSQPVVPAILDPTQGHPLILRAGGQFRFLMRLGPGLEGSAILTLRHGRVETLTFPLEAVGGMSRFQQRYASAELRLPDKMPTGSYDLVLICANREIVSRHSIRVVDEYKTRFRFVHLSDMTIDDPSAPVFDERLVEEINLLAPEFIVATGDYTAWGQALDDATSWIRVLDFFAGFDAPVYLVCGDRDHQASFTQYIAQSPICPFDYGHYHGILLMDHGAHPLDRNQLEFLRRDLDMHANATFNMIVMHNDDLSFLDLLASREALPGYLETRKVRLIMTGGSDDWDRTEYAAQMEGLNDVKYIRTHQSSTCFRGRATGISHYRVIEVDGDQVSYVYANDSGEPGIEHSIPVGFLRVFYEFAGTQRVSVSVQNGLNQRFDDAQVWVRVAKNGDAQPKVGGGRLVQTLDAGREWLCAVGVDLPDKSGFKAIVATDGRELPPPVPIKVAYQGSHELTFRAKRTKAGLSYFTSPQPITLTLTNTSQREHRTFPIVRLNGSKLPIKADGKSTWPITVPAGGQSILVPSLILGRVSQGDHLLQIIFLEDPLCRVTTFPVTLARQ